MRKETRKFMYGIYKASDRAERNLFTSKNSVIKLCSGTIYLDENFIKGLYHKSHTIVLKLMPSICCSGGPACLIGIFLP